MIKTKIYLSALENLRPLIKRYPIFQSECIPFGLQSYYYVRSKTGRNFMDYIVPHVKELMLDSGAFSYMNALKNGSKLKNPDWNSYADEYCDYINDYGIDKFLELDLGGINAL